MTRARIGMLSLALGAIVIGAVLVDAQARRAARDGRVHGAAVELTGLPDLALSSSSRWLRHPSQAEPGAPFADLPASLDTDPGGALIGPPRAIVRAGAPVVRRR